MIVTRDMHERKRLMFERSDAFVALPGGVGTLEELVEQLTWQQLGRHSKPIMLANVAGFWEPLLALLAHMRATAFIRPTLAVNILQADRVDDILPKLRTAASGTLDSKHMPADVADRLYPPLNRRATVQRFVPLLTPARRPSPVCRKLNPSGPGTMHR
jgi:hypothetical protein